ncbi:MAG: FeoA family protein, partial [Alistipes ihumii]
MEKPILYKRLSELKTSEQGVITKVFGHGSFRNRITEMGFVRGKAVKVIKNAPLLDPIEYEIMGYRIALRKSEAELIEVTVAENAFGPSSRHGDATFRDESVNRFLHEAGKTINVALVGNPAARPDRIRDHGLPHRAP